MPPSWRHSERPHAARLARSRCWRRGGRRRRTTLWSTRSKRSCTTCAAGGIGPTDRVAVALPNGPEAAAAVLGTVAAAVCAPLAPDLPEAEFANQLTTLGVRAVMVLRGHETAARAAASSCGIPVIELDAGETAGSIACSGLSPGDAASSRAADTARGPAVVHLGHDRVPRSSSRSPNAIC